MENSTLDFQNVPHTKKKCLPFNLKSVGLKNIVWLTAKLHV